jgi:glycosyltransferase involved in cell wall biosynthesis
VPALLHDLLSFVVHLSWAAVWFWLLGLIGLVWLRRHLNLNRAKQDPVLSAADAEQGAGPWPRLSVLVAAKDEQGNIGHCLAGLLSQDYPDFEVIVVDDRSTDRTGEIIDEAAAREPRVKALHVRELPAGWAGKNHAMHTGVQGAIGEYLCFTDADCRFHTPRLLRAAVRYAQRKQLDFFSVLPELEAHTFWERVVQPPAGAIMVFWFPPEKVNDPRSSRAYANGAFMLLRRAAYDKLGGHEQLRAVLNEDMHFARQAKRVGLRFAVLRGRGLYSVRMYVGLRQIWHGWSRIFYGCFGTWPRLIVSAIFLSVFSVSPWASLLISPLAGRAGVGIAAAAAFAIVAQQTVLRRFYPLCGMPAAWALSYPLGAALCLGMTCNAMTRLAGVRTRWRGTSYTGGA